MNKPSDNVFSLGFEIKGSGPVMVFINGRYEPIIGVFKNGFPVFKQVQSSEIPSKFNFFLLYR